MVRALTDIVVSELVRVEVPAALWRKVRIESPKRFSADILVRQFESDYFGWGHCPLFDAAAA